jgi:hypothetical protein
MANSILTEYANDDRSRVAILKVNNDTFSVDFYQNEEYYHTTEYVSKSIHFVQNVAENYVLGVFGNVRDFAVV